jgi:hypothetical protein
MRTKVGVGFVLVAIACGGADPQSPAQSTASSQTAQPHLVTLDFAASEVACRAHGTVESACLADPLCMMIAMGAPCSVDAGACPQALCQARPGVDRECSCAGSQVCVAGDDAGNNALHCETPIARCSSTDPCACLSAGEPPQCSHSGSVIGLCVCRAP